MSRFHRGQLTPSEQKMDDEITVRHYGVVADQIAGDAADEDERAARIEREYQEWGMKPGNGLSKDELARRDHARQAVKAEQARKRLLGL